MIDKWLALLNTMVVEGGRESHCTAADIQLFETHAGVKPPLGFGDLLSDFWKAVNSTIAIASGAL